MDQSLFLSDLSSHNRYNRVTINNNAAKSHLNIMVNLEDLFRKHRKKMKNHDSSASVRVKIRFMFPLERKTTSTNVIKEINYPKTE